MTKVEVRPGQDIGSALKVFKKKCAKAGIMKEFKRAQRFEKPSERRRKQARESLKRARLASLEEL
ncbi:MAG: 30S ribosomal protein S21 [bacterium]|nr:30S ribosomal protein S21 [bacterium]